MHDRLKTVASPGFANVVALNVRTWVGFMRRRPRGDISLWLWPTGGLLVLSIVVIAAVIVLLMATIDVPAIIWARALTDSVHRIFAFMTWFGKSGWFLWPFGVLLIALALVPPARLGTFGAGVAAAVAVRVTFLFAAIAVPGIFTGIAKDIIGRARPFVGGSPNAFLYHPFAWTPAYASLPSGHTTTAVAAAVAIGALWPASRPYVWLYAFIIMVSRLIVTAHHPSDIVAGAVVGSVGALLVRNWFAARRLAFTIEPDGSIRPMPGPRWPHLKTVTGRILGR